MSDPLLFIIVLSNKRKDDTFACISSLLKSDYSNLKIILLDYELPGNTAQIIHQRHPQVQIIPLTENLGYAGNNNIGIRAAMEQGAEWLLILNDDTILDPSCLSSLVQVGESDSEIGIVGPMVYHFEEPDVIQSAGGSFDRYWYGFHLGMNETDQGQFPEPREVEWISGCAILVRRELIENVGALDADYFLYWEELEWCIRAAQAGWRIFHVPHAKLWHKGVNRNYQPRPYVTYYMTRNYLRTLAKHKAPFWIQGIAIINILRTLVSWSVKPRWSGKQDHRNAMWKGILDYVQHRSGPMPS